MDKKLILGLVATLILVVVLGLYIFQQNSKVTSENQQNQASTSQPSGSTALTQTVTYEGVLPCADCSGIDTKITLNPDNTFEMTEIYQGKNDDNPFVTKGTWTLETGTPANPNAQVYALTTETGETYFYLLDGDKLTSLDADKNLIDAPFNMSLTKVSS